MSNGPDLRIKRDDKAGTVMVLDGDRVIIGWQFHERFAIPHWFPLRTPSGKELLAQHPDPFPHHRAMWVADKVQLEDGPIVDFYHCTKNQLDPKDPSKGYRHFIRQRGAPQGSASGDRAEIACSLRWVINGAPVLTDARRMIVRVLDDGEALVDLGWRLGAGFGDVTFHSDWVHYGWPFLRMHPQYSVQQGGRLVDDVGRVGQKATNAQYANWVDYSNSVDGVTEGVAVFVPQESTWRKWLTRDYGTFGPRRPDQVSGTRFTLAKRQGLTGSARLFIHRGNEKTGNVAARYREYVEEQR